MTETDLKISIQGIGILLMMKLLVIYLALFTALKSIE